MVTEGYYVEYYVWPPRINCKDCGQLGHPKCGLKVCFNCGIKGHVSQDCKEEQQCRICAGKHQIRTCKLHITEMKIAIANKKSKLMKIMKETIVRM